MTSPPGLMRNFRCEALACTLTVEACLRRRVARGGPWTSRDVVRFPFCAEKCPQGRALAAEVARTVEDAG